MHHFLTRVTVAVQPTRAHSMGHASLTTTSSRQVLASPAADCAAPRLTYVSLALLTSRTLLIERPYVVVRDRTFGCRRLATRCTARPPLAA